MGAAPGFHTSPCGLSLQGVHYLVDSGLLEWRAASVAEFLYKEEGLNKTAIGNFLGERYGSQAACACDGTYGEVAF